jgi:hypothetical protein
VTNKEPNWQRLCQETSVPNWDLENGHPVSKDLWWTAKLFYDRIVTEECNWLLPFVSPCGDGSIHFSWVYGYRKFNLEITDGLWYTSEKDVFWRHSADGLLPEETFKKVQAFYRKSLVGKRRQFV